jgi:hypothetical protein
VWTSGPQKSVGDAVGAWIEHVCLAAAWWPLSPQQLREAEVVLGATSRITPLPPGPVIHVSNPTAAAELPPWPWISPAPMTSANAVRLSEALEQVHRAGVLEPLPLEARTAQRDAAIERARQGRRWCGSALAHVECNYAALEDHSGLPCDAPCEVHAQCPFKQIDGTENPDVLRKARAL